MTADRASGVRGTPVSLDTRADPGAFAAWRQRLARIYDVEKDADAAFAVSGTTWQLPQAFVTHSRLSPVTQTRSAELIARAPVDQVSLFRCRSGTVEADYDGHGVTLGAGDLLFIDYMRPTRSVSSEVVTDTLIFPRDTAPARFGTGALHGVVLRADSPAGAIVGAHMDALVGTIGRLTIVEAEATFAALVTLAAALWPSTPQSSAEIALLDRVRTEIAARLAAPELTPELLATTLGVSRAALYRVLAPEGGVSAYVQRLRLDASLKLLISGDNAPGLVGRVAADLGYRHAAHFSRAFRVRFGLSPSAVAGLSANDVGGHIFTGWLDTLDSLPELETLRAWLRTAAAEAR